MKWTDDDMIICCALGVVIALIVFTIEIAKNKGLPW
jgi:hypothetical protein